MKRALLFLTAGLLSLLLFGSLAVCGEQDLAPRSNNDQMNDQMKSEVKPGVKAEVGAIRLSAAAPAPAPAAEEEEEDQFGC